MSNTENQKNYILGIDVGTNSVGWAVVNCDIQHNGNAKGIYSGYEPTELVALNSRIFQESVNAKTRVPKNQTRREKRGERNRRHYYKKRRTKLTNLLIQQGFIPSDYSDSPASVLNYIDKNFAEVQLGKQWSSDWSDVEKYYCSPYAIRYYATRECLTKHQLGRLLLHLQRRRGYFSNRGAKYIELVKYLNLSVPEDDKSSSDGKILTGNETLWEQLGDNALGDFIWNKVLATGHSPMRITNHYIDKEKFRKDGTSIINKIELYATREMYELEFEKIIAKQKPYHPELEEILREIEYLIFHQRPLQSQKNKVGNCNIHKFNKRCATAKLEFQEFRILQTINNITIDNEELSMEQRTMLFERAKVSDSISFKCIEELFGGISNYGSKERLIGNKTGVAIAKIIGKNRQGQCIWNSYSYEKQKQLVEDLLTIHNQKALYNRLVNYWCFSSYQESGEESIALKLVMDLKLEEGYTKYSLKAINQLLKYMRVGIQDYEAVNKIGHIESITSAIETNTSFKLLSEKDIPNVANPVVQKSLYEIRRVVNSVIKMYGMPSVIRIELGRELKSSKAHRISIREQQKKNMQRNKRAEQEIIELHKSNTQVVKLKQTHNGMYRVSRNDKTKFKLWHYEQKEQCPYCLRKIGLNELFSGEFEVEHILPYSGFRQSYMNTVISCRTCNQSKGQRTPYETWGHDIERWTRIETFAKEHYTKQSSQGDLSAKQRNILKKNYKPEDLNDFVERQLNDTRYIAKAARTILSSYGVPIHVVSGGTTSELRKRLGLNNILPQNPNQRLYSEQEGYLLLNEQKSRDDHRHHAIDAFVIALTDRLAIKALAELHKAAQDFKYSPDRSITKEQWKVQNTFKLPVSWLNKESLTKQVLDILDRQVVSHMTRHKIWGELHKASRYGLAQYPVKLILDPNNSIFKQVARLIENEAFDSNGWISDQNMKLALAKWIEGNQNLKPADRQPARLGTKKLKYIYYAMPMSVIRKPLDGESMAKLVKEWSTNPKTWITEPNIHKSLYYWLEKNQLVGANKNQIQRELEINPPKVLNKKREEGEIIKNIRQSSAYTQSFIHANNTTLLMKESNHHMIIFNNGKEGEERQFRVKMVSMIEAAKRRSSKQAIVCKQPLAEWGEGWFYQQHLFSNDVVEWLDLSIFEKERVRGNFAPSHLITPYFRVQKMSWTNSTKAIYFRHHTVTAADDKDKWGLLPISSLNKIKCKVISPANLGLSIFND